MQGNWAKKILEQYGGELERLNVHSHQGCNLYCSGCNHHSEILDPSESIDIDQTIKDLDHILSLVKIRFINILGGEPLLNPKGTREICEFLIDKNQKVKLTTNGIYLSNNEDWIFPLIKKGMILKISVHLSKNDKGHSKLHQNILNFSEKALKQKIKFLRRNTIPADREEGWVEISQEFLRKKYWFHLFDQKDNKVYPFDSNKEDAFKICESNCPQLYNSKLYKCPHTAYFKDVLNIKGQMNDEVWQKYLDYDGYNIYDDNEIKTFLKSVYVSENICSSCPGTPTYVTINQDYSVKKKIIPIYD